MSEDVKKDILKAIQDSKEGKEPDNAENIAFPDPKILQHSLNKGEVTFPSPEYRQDGKDK